MIAEAAHTNKLTLYYNFESKDVLIVEYLRRLAADTEKEWEAIVGEDPDNSREPCLALLRLATSMCSNSDRGEGDFINAIAQLAEPDHPAHKVIQEHKRKQRKLIALFCWKLGIEDPDEIADQVLLLIEGACVSLQISGPDGPGSRLLSLIENLLTPKLKVDS